jgi:hypothetical protein
MIQVKIEHIQSFEKRTDDLEICGIDKYSNQRDSGFEAMHAFRECRRLRQIMHACENLQKRVEEKRWSAQRESYRVMSWLQSGTLTSLHLKKINKS